MFKKLTLSVTTFALVFSFVASVTALEGVTVGLKYWYPFWTMEYPGRTYDYNTNFGMFGPAITVVFSEKFAASASLFLGSFELDEASITEDATRGDLDLVGAYIINPYFNVFECFRWF